MAAKPETGSKRDKPSDSDELPLFQKQTERQTRQRQYTGDILLKDMHVADALSHIDLDSGVFNNTTSIDNFAVGELTKAVTSILLEPNFVSTLSSIMSTHVANNLSKSIEATCQQCIEPYVQKIDEQNKVIESLVDRVSVLEHELEEQQQYSRRTSLRFNSVKLPTNEEGNIEFPVDTDSLVLNICNDNLEQPITINDIGRTHTIGKITEGKASIIARFISYRKRQMVYSNKRKLKDHPDGTFISENLTRQRFQIIRKLNHFRKKGDINSYWTQDGRVFVKPSENSDRRDFKIISTEADILSKLGLDASKVKLSAN